MTDAPDLESLLETRRRLHRTTPSRPLSTVRAARAFVAERGVAFVSARGGPATLADAIVGHEIRGSWMADPEVHRIHRIVVGLARTDLVFAPLYLGRECALDPSLAPAFVRFATDHQRSVQATRGLSRLARRILERTLEAGELRMDRSGIPSKESRKARLELERIFLVRSESLHTERGYHTALVRPWGSTPFDRFARESARLSLDEALEALVTAGVRSAVVVPEREVSRWFEFDRNLIEDLVARGRLERHSQGRTLWLAMAGPESRRRTEQ